MDKSPLDRIRKSLGGPTGLDSAIDAMAQERQEQILERIFDFSDFVVVIVKALEEVVESYVADDYQSMNRKVEEMERLEDEADDRKQEIADRLSVSGAFHIGRGDLARLVTSLDIIANYAVGAADRMAMRPFTLPEEINDKLLRMAGVCVEAVERLRDAIRALDESFRKAIEVAGEVDAIESKADKLYADIYTFMFEWETDFKTFHQLKSIIDRLESVADRAAENAEIIRHMSLEYLE